MPGRGAPGRGAPGRGACGRGIGRSTGCCEENGLLPTRGARAAGLGAGPGPRTGRCAGCRSGRGRGRCRRRRRSRRSSCSRRWRRRGCRGLSWRGGRLGRRRLRGRLRGGLGRRAVAVGLDLLRGRLRAAERFAQPARNGSLHSGGRGFDEFALIAQSGEDFLTGDTEFLCQLVHAGLTCHYISISRGVSGGRRCASG